MKTRFFFLLLAAVLLGSVSVKAQSETPLKGDVNGDGKVDVADIVAIIESLQIRRHFCRSCIAATVIGFIQHTFLKVVGSTAIFINNISFSVFDLECDLHIVGTGFPCKRDLT